MATATTLTQTLVKAWSSDMTIIKRERIHMERLAFLLKNEDVPKETKRELKKLSEKIVEGCWAVINYGLGKQAKDSSEALGRLNAVGNVGLQGVKRDVRNFLAEPYYWDIDMIAAHPTLCLSMCRTQKLTCEYQTELIEKREEKLAELMDVMGCSRSTAKDYITILYFGEENASSALPMWFKSLHQEISNARKVITQNEEWTEALKFLNGKKKNRMGSAFSFILQSVERECLLAMERSAKKHGRSLDTYIHDGGLIRKREGEEAFPDELLREFEKDIEADTGYCVHLASKEMETSWTLKEGDDRAYQEKKDWFENNQRVFAVKYPAMYCRVFEGELQMLDRGDVIHNWEGETYGEDNEPFLTRWFKDPHKRHYEGLVFMPMVEVPANKFNMFLGWKYEPVRDDARMERYLYLISNLCNHDKGLEGYVLDWLAHKIQRPYYKMGVSLIINGKKGAGKDTCFDIFGEMLGPYFHNTGTPENDVFSTFNGVMKNNLMVKIEEGNFATNSANESKLKHYITATEISVQQKNKDQIKLHNSTDFVFTCNETIPIVMTDDERRWACIKMSDERRGDLPFWEETNAMLRHTDTYKAMMWFFLNRDISNFKPRKYPETEYLKDMKEAFMPIHAVWFRQWIERNQDEEGICPTFRVQAEKILESINETSKFKRTHRWLRGEMDDHYKGVFERIAPKNITYYRFDPDVMRNHLKAKGWWSEL